MQETPPQARPEVFCPAHGLTLAPPEAGLCTRPWWTAGQGEAGVTRCDRPAVAKGVGLLSEGLNLLIMSRFSSQICWRVRTPWSIVNITRSSCRLLVSERSCRSQSASKTAILCCEHLHAPVVGGHRRDIGCAPGGTIWKQTRSNSIGGFIG